MSSEIVIGSFTNCEKLLEELNRLDTEFKNKNIENIGINNDIPQGVSVYVV